MIMGYFDESETKDFVCIYEDLGWKQLENREDKISEALTDFISVIRRFTISGIGVGLDVPPYLEITKDAKKREKPEVFCFERVLKTSNRTPQQMGV